MAKVFATIHQACVVLALFAALAVLADIAVRWRSHDSISTFDHVLVGSLCAGYAATHLVCLRLRRPVWYSSVAFYPLYVLIGGMAALVARGSAKGWAPADPSQQAWANLIGYGLLTVTFAVAMASCFVNRGSRDGA